MKGYIWWIATVWLLSVTVTDGARSVKKKYNIILSMADDLGWNDVGWKNDRINTPFLTQMANDGIKLERHYMHRFCSPSRSMLMGGKHPFKHGQQTDLNLNPVSTTQCAVQQEIKFFPSTLQKIGYKTHMVGKWHLGHYAKKFTPTERGFNSFVGYYAGGTDTMTQHGVDHLNTKMLGVNKCSCRGKGRSDREECTKATECMDVSQLVNNSGKEYTLVNPKYVKAFDFADTLFGHEAVRIIKDHNKRHPLFLFLSWSSPHSPSQSPKRNYLANTGLTKVLRMGQCLERLRIKHSGMMNAVDKAHESIVGALKAKNMWQDTILIFMSDNGGHNELKGISKSGNTRDCNAHGPNTVKSGSNWPLRGGKFTHWEGGIRSVGFVYSPNSRVIPRSSRGKSWSGLMSGVDWSRTIFEAIGQKNALARHEAPDGIAMWDRMVQLQNSPRKVLPVQVWKEAKRYVLIMQDPKTQHLFKLIRGYPGYIRDLGYLHRDIKIDKLSSTDRIQRPLELRKSDPQYDAQVVKKENTVFHCTGDKPCLFDITDDPSETINLADSRSSQAMMRKLDKELNKWKALEVPFVGSNLCYKGDKRSQSKLKSTNVMDPNSLKFAAVCGRYIVPWVGVHGKVMKESECPINGRMPSL